jgi:hypothetical protein
MKKQSSRLLLPLLCLLVVGLTRTPSHVSAASFCGSCSFRGCVGAAEGHSCLTFTGAPGQCLNTGKLCGDHVGYCGCYAI